MPIPYNFAVPSWVFAGDIAENVHFLHDKVAEIALLCFEPSLPDITRIHDTKCTWHLHLPSVVPHDFFCTQKNTVATDIRWENPWDLAKDNNDIRFFAKICVDIFTHCAKLEPWTAVLHCPPTTNFHTSVENKLRVFLDTWKQNSSIEAICIENVQNANPMDFRETFKTYPQLGICLDIAHAIAYNQTSFLDDVLMQRVVLMHWSAPHARGTTDKAELGRDRHLSLEHLLDYQALCVKALQKVPESVKHVLEIFSWEEIEESAPIFYTFQQLASKS